MELFGNTMRIDIEFLPFYIQLELCEMQADPFFC